MLAAADYAEGKKDARPPQELRLAFRCVQWNALPNPGGLMDQPAGLVEQMTIALNTYNAMKSWKAREPGKEGEFAKHYPDTWGIVQEVIRLRKHG